jgi:flagellar hook-associated protein 2
VSFKSGIVDGSAKIDPSGNAIAIKFKLNGIDITIPKDSTYDQAIATINSKSAETNVKVSNAGGSLVFTTTGVGKDNSITISEASPEARGYLKITDGTTNITSKAATDANVALFSDPEAFSDGADVTPGYAIINGTKIFVSSNTFTYDGVQFNLKQDIPAKSNVAVSITTDTDKVFDKIKTLVDKYNELIKDLNDKLSESKNRNYPPLTDAQKKDMKDADIKLWEDKAKSGLLANDPTIRQFLTQLRTSMSEAIKTPGINTSFDTLQEIGITTSTNYRDQGKLTLDESKLKSLLTTNLSDIQKMFSNRDDSGTSMDTTVTNSTKHNNSGFAIRVYDRINDTLSKLVEKAGSPGSISISSVLAKEAKSLTDQMTKVKDRLNAQEQSLWAKFNAMESALQKLNTQSSWLTQQLSK